MERNGSARVLRFLRSSLDGTESPGSKGPDRRASVKGLVDDGSEGRPWPSHDLCKYFSFDRSFTNTRLCGCPRAFDPKKDQRPVSWLMENLTREIYPRTFQWMVDQLGDVVTPINSELMPDWGFL